MNFIHTLWTKPLLYGDKNKEDLKLSIEITIFNYALSMRLIQMYGHTITLYTDREGFYLLGFLPYNKIVIIDISNEDIQFAALIKFRALEECKPLDFIIDGDIFLTKQEGYTVLLKLSCLNDCIYSIIETFQDLDKIKKSFKPVIDIILDSNILPGYQALTNNIHYPNTSIMFIKNLKLRELYLELYKYHKFILQGKDFLGVWPDVWIELYFLGLLLDNNKCFVHTPVIPDYPNELEATRLGITHLGKVKKQMHSNVLKGLMSIDNALYNKGVLHLKEVCNYYIK